jgi:hypothetical protein
MSTFSKRIEDLKSRGFKETKVGMTNDKYSFLWYQIDTDEISDIEWEDYLLKLTNTQTKSI